MKTAEQIIEENYLLQEGTFLHSLNDSFWDEEKKKELVKALKEYAEKEKKNNQTKRNVFHIYRMVVVFINSHCDVNDVFCIKNLDKNVEQLEYTWNFENLAEEILCN